MEKTGLTFKKVVEFFEYRKIMKDIGIGLNFTNK